MSNLSYITKKYRNYSELTDRINNATIVLKKRKIAKGTQYNNSYKKFNLTDEEIERAFLFLTEFLEEIQQVGDDELVDKYDFIVNDEKFFERLQSIPNFQESLNKVLDNLKHRKILTEIQTKFLDTVLNKLDYERSILFKKMRVH